MSIESMVWLFLLFASASAFWSPEQLRQKIPDLENLESSYNLKPLKPALYKAFQSIISDLKSDLDPSAKIETPEYPYYRWIPIFLDNLYPGQATNSTQPCFHQTNVSVSQTNSDFLTITVTTGEKTSIDCEDFYMFATLTGTEYLEIATNGKYSVNWSISSYDDDELWDLKTKGIRWFRFADNKATTIYDLEQTLDLFASNTEEINLNFMQNYVNVTYPIRTAGTLTLNNSDLHFGDFIGQMALGGLETMMAWGMGSVTSHTAIVVEDPNTNEFLVCESTSPVIRCSPFQQWMLGEGNSLATLAPLAEDFRNNFNKTAAWNYIQSQLGYSYGYMNFLFGWIDTPNENYPCVPPYPSEICLLWQQVEILTGLVEQFSPYLAEVFYRQAFRLRLNNTQTLPDIASIYRYADSLGLDTPDLFTAVEQDSYRYNTTLNGNMTTGQSMVCDVFVCNVWKAAGVFNIINNDFNCAELTNWDDYVLTLFDPNYETTRPEVCQQADPNVPVCPVTGDHELTFNNYMTKDPYPHMAEHCPGQPPSYYRPPNC